MSTRPKPPRDRTAPAGERLGGGGPFRVGVEHARGGPELDGTVDLCLRRGRHEHSCARVYSELHRERRDAAPCAEHEHRLAMPQVAPENSAHQAVSPASGNAAASSHEPRRLREHVLGRDRDQLGIRPVTRPAEDLEFRPGARPPQHPRRGSAGSRPPHRCRAGSLLRPTPGRSATETEPPASSAAEGRPGRVAGDVDELERDVHCHERCTACAECRAAHGRAPPGRRLRPRRQTPWQNLLMLAP